MAPQELLTAKQVADRIGISTRTLRRWIDAGYFPGPTLFGSRPRWTEEDWAAYKLLAGRWRPAGSEPPEDDEDEESDPPRKKPDKSEKTSKGHRGTQEGQQ
jgi:excisionase family DNA binding protein